MVDNAPLKIYKLFTKSKREELVLA